MESLDLYYKAFLVCGFFFLAIFINPTHKAAMLDYDVYPVTKNLIGY